MTEQKESDQHAGEATPGAAEKTNAPSGSRAPLVVLVVLLVMVAAGGLGAFNYWLKKSYQPHRTAVDERLITIGGRIDGVAEDVGGASQNAGRIDAKLDAFERSQQELKSALERLYTQQAQGGDGWQLKEVEYLMVIGSQRIRLDRDVDSAIAALQSADDRLRDIGDPALIPLRGELTHELNALKSVQPVDIAGLALYLADIVERVGGLPLADSGLALLASEPAVEPAQHEGWRGVLWEMWDDLINVIDIKQLETPDAALFDPDARQTLYQNVRLDLASARLAVLRRDSKNFHASLGLVKKLLDSYFDLGNQGVINVIETLEQMSQVELAPALPEIGGSLKTLRGLQANAD